MKYNTEVFKEWVKEQHFVGISIERTEQDLFDLLTEASEKWPGMKWGFDRLGEEFLINELNDLLNLTMYGGFRYRGVSRQWELFAKSEEYVEKLDKILRSQIQQQEKQIQNLEKAHEEFLNTQLDFYKLAKPVLWQEFTDSNPSSLDIGNLLNFLEAKLKAKDKESLELKQNTKQFLTNQIQLIKGVIE